MQQMRSRRRGFRKRVQSLSRCWFRIRDGCCTEVFELRLRHQHRKGILIDDHAGCRFIRELRIKAETQGRVKCNGFGRSATGKLMKVILGGVMFLSSLLFQTDLCRRSGLVFSRVIVPRAS
jgi:hypothetical protein